MWRKGVCPYDYMNGWEKTNETSLPEKKGFDDITDADCKHLKKVCENFEIKNLVSFMIWTFKVTHYC